MCRGGLRGVKMNRTPVSRELADLVRREAHRTAPGGLGLDLVSVGLDPFFCGLSSGQQPQ